MRSNVAALILALSFGCTAPQTAAVETTAHVVLVQADALLAAAQADPTLVPALATRLQGLAGTSATAAQVIATIQPHVTTGNLALARVVLSIAIAETAPVPIAQPAPAPAPPPGAP